MRIKAVAQSFLLPDNIKAICFVLWNVRSTGEIAKRSRNCDVNERQTEGGSHNGSVWVKRKTRGEREMRRREEMKSKHRREVVKAARERERDRGGAGRTESGTETGWTDGCGQ